MQNGLEFESQILAFQRLKRWTISISTDEMLKNTFFLPALPDYNKTNYVSRISNNLIMIHPNASYTQLSQTAPFNPSEHGSIYTIL